MEHDSSSLSKLLVRGTESRTRNLEAKEHVLFCPSFWHQTNLVPECMADYPSFWYEIVVPVTWTENFGSCAMGLIEVHVASVDKNSAIELFKLTLCRISVGGGRNVPLPRQE